MDDFQNFAFYTTTNSQSPPRPDAATNPIMSSNQNNDSSASSTSLVVSSHNSYPGQTTPSRILDTHSHVAGTDPYAAIPNIQPLALQFQQQPTHQSQGQQFPAYSTSFSNASAMGMDSRLQPQGLPHSAQGRDVPNQFSTERHSSASYASSPVRPSSSRTYTNEEEVASLEDKRQRNVAASARSRSKKKQKSSELERTVSELSLRAGELEKEVSELRKENTWLKEIVVMKGRSKRMKNQGMLVGSSTLSIGDDDSETSSAEDNETSLPTSPSPSERKETKKRGKGKGKKKDKFKA